MSSLAYARDKPVILTLNPSITVILTLNAVKGKNLATLRTGPAKELVKFNDG